jgi:5-methylcytosine-specific restriction endonuclease McrA
VAACATDGVALTTPVVNDGPPRDRPEITPLSPDRYKLEVTISGEAYEMLLRIRDLMGHSVPDGDPAAIIERSLQEMLAHLERRRTARAERPHRMARCRSGTRYIPAAVRREVWTRDQHRCAFIGAAGRCRGTRRLEIHHLAPYAVGGVTSVDNLELRCRAHNVYEAELYFGFTAADGIKAAEPP